MLQATLSDVIGANTKADSFNGRCVTGSGFTYQDGRIGGGFTATEGPVYDQTRAFEGLFDINQAAVGKSLTFVRNLSSKPAESAQQVTGEFWDRTVYGTSTDPRLWVATQGSLSFTSVEKTADGYRLGVTLSNVLFEKATGVIPETVTSGTFRLSGNGSGININVLK